MRILVVEDNKELVGLLAKALGRAGLDVDSAGNAGDAEISLKTMPDADGLAVLDQMQRRRDRTPVLILSARGGLDDRLAGLHKGASDYVVKPFAMDELVARLQALMRRSPGSQGNVLTLGNVSFDTEGPQATVAGKVLLLPAREAEVLEILLKRSGRTVSHDALEGQVFGMSQSVSSNAIEVYVHRLRHILADAGANVAIHTIRGVGYLMELAKDDRKSTAGSPR